MKSKKITLLSTIPLLVSSCSQYGSHYLLMSADSLLTENTLKQFDLCEVESLMGSNNEFMVYFSSTGCSSCDLVTDSLKQYLPNNPVLIFNLDYAVDKELVSLVVARYPTMFKEIFPSIYIVKGQQTTIIPTTKLNSSTRLINTFYEYQHKCNIYYSDDDILHQISKSPTKFPFEDFGYVAFDFDNESLLSSYNQNLASYLEQFEKPVILANYEEYPNLIEVASVHVTKEGLVTYTDETTTSNFSNIDVVKKVLNT